MTLPISVFGWSELTFLDAILLGAFVVRVLVLSRDAFGAVVVVVFQGRAFGRFGTFCEGGVRDVRVLFGFFWFTD